MKIISPVIALVLGFAAVSAFAQAPAAPANPAKGDARAGKQKAVAVCSGCHGIPGTKTAFPEVYNVPRIGGQNEAYLVSALRAYRGGERYNATMKGLASALSEKEVVDVAAYFASAEMGK
ncbi:MAG: cytochrome c [Pseudomonadota bacterium]